MDIVSIYTDGSCLGNHLRENKGGWAGILTCRGHEKVIFGSETNTTNNRMELTAAIQCLSALKRRCKVTLITDSTYVMLGIERRAIWEKKGSLTNGDLWSEMYRLLNYHKVKVQWLKGHAGDAFNERCDQLAKDAALAE